MMVFTVIGMLSCTIAGAWTIAFLGVRGADFLCSVRRHKETRERLAAMEKELLRVRDQLAAVRKELESYRSQSAYRGRVVPISEAKANKP